MAIDRDFVRDGFVELKIFLSERETAEARDLLESTLSRPHGMACTRPNNTPIPLSWDDPLADDLKWISGYASVKDAKTPPLWWHQDWWCWDPPWEFFLRDSPQIAVLCCLIDGDAANGAQSNLGNTRATACRYVKPDRPGDTGHARGRCDSHRLQASSRNSWKFE